MEKPPGAPGRTIGFLPSAELTPGVPAIINLRREDDPGTSQMDSHARA